MNRRKVGENLDEEDGKENIFRIATQIMRKNRDVVGGRCVKDVGVKIAVEKHVMKVLERVIGSRVRKIVEVDEMVMV